MTHIIRTTITLPTETYKRLRFFAYKDNTSVSKIITNLANEKFINKNIKKQDDPMNLLGKYKKGITEIYTNRDELYEKEIKRKLANR